ncbi:MAG TPA: L-seryl-tRNA(Sec) selenium transferase, partial [Desulfurivibrionaceae bacterium]|nr:L-seryl-tRNA(Sec) selenium transferase [Desulfurivibrionaceae bacterium]
MSTGVKTKNVLPAKAHELLQAIPKVDEFLGWLAGEGVEITALVKETVRETLDECRTAIQAGTLQDQANLDRKPLRAIFADKLAKRNAPNFIRLINATGVVIHTNLGRSVLPAEAMARINEVGAGYSNLEFDLATGKRGSRYSLVEALLCQLTGAEAGLVVNNNAAAVLLALDTLAKGREAIVSRGQLVEIGGSFRIPEVMARSGARLVEVGATNRTHLRDYQAAIGEETALLLKVHTSNYRIIGFTAEVPLADLVALGRQHNLTVMEDLGSGCLLDLSRYGLLKEPTVREVVDAGPDVVTFSGDKLLGGPQAGIIVGRREIIERIKQNPLTRALRIDKFTLAGLEAVLRLYQDERQALRQIPTLAMLSMSPAEIGIKARRLKRLLTKPLADYCRVALLPTVSRVGGGALPEYDLPSVAVSLAPAAFSVNELEVRLRRSTEPVLGRIENDLFLLDLRTVAESEIKRLAVTIFKI